MGEDLEGCDISIPGMAVFDGGDEQVFNGVNELLLEGLVGSIMLFV